MKAILQRVTFAEVKVDGNTVGKIDNGFLILLGVAEGDTEKEADALSSKIATLRVFTDENDKMNLNVQQAGGSVLVVSQFTLAADTSRGMRPGFSHGAAPEQADKLYQYFVERCRAQGMQTETGRFAADMKVSLVNDGPVTFWLQI